ncbi:MAG: hypothetical protein H7A35_16575 [Planctomycetales bacterium]|nr:hypothetical protein [bacterium]UNM08442.1 MAG: hypothetical protein H7A35_16575 [Planctomycetales bacterium]
MAASTSIISEYQEFYSPIQRNFAGWRRGALPVIIALLCLLALCALLFMAGWWLPGPTQNLAELFRDIGEFCRALLLPAALTGWVVLALANLRIADSLLDEALLGRRGSSASFRFILTLHSGLWPVLVGATLLATVLAAQSFQAANATEPSWLGPSYNWDSMMEHVRGELLVRLGNLPGELAMYCGFTAIALALACMARRSSTVWLVFCLLNLQLLLDILAAFLNVNVYALYWQDTMYSTRPLLFLLMLAGAALVYGLPLIALKASDRPLLYAFAWLSIMRTADLFLALSRNGFVASVQYDDSRMPLLNFSWHANLAMKYPLFSCLPENFNRIYGFGRGIFEDRYMLMFMDQVREGLPCGSWGIAVAWLGNLAWLAAVLAVCLYSVRRFEKEQIT